MIGKYFSINLFAKEAFNLEYTDEVGEQEEDPPLIYDKIHREIGKEDVTERKGKVRVVEDDRGKVGEAESGDHLEGHEGEEILGIRGVEALVSSNAIRDHDIEEKVEIYHNEVPDDHGGEIVGEGDSLRDQREDLPSGPADYFLDEVSDLDGRDALDEEDEIDIPT